MILFALFSLLDNIHICKDFTFKSADYVQICHPCVFKVTWFSFCCLVSWFLASTGQPLTRRSTSSSSTPPSPYSSSNVRHHLDLHFLKNLNSANPLSELLIFFDSLLAHIHMCLKSNTDLILNNQITVHAVSTSFALPWETVKAGNVSMVYPPPLAWLG